MKHTSLLALGLLLLLVSCSSKPKPPQGAFPKQISRFVLNGEPVIMEGDKGIGYSNYFSATYFNPEKEQMMYLAYMFSSPDEARKGLQGLKQRLQHDYPDKYQYLQETPDRFVAIYKETGVATVYRVAGNWVIDIGSGQPAAVADFENNLPYAAYGVSKPPPAPQPEPSLDYTPILALLDDFNKLGDRAAAKYNDKYLLLSGTVSATGKTKEGIPFIGFLKPGATKYDFKDGTGALFKKEETDKVLALKKGQEVKFGCGITVGLGQLLMHDCNLQ